MVWQAAARTAQLRGGHFVQVHGHSTRGAEPLDAVPRPPPARPGGVRLVEGQRERTVLAQELRLHHMRERPAASGAASAKPGRGGDGLLQPWEGA